MAAVPIRFGVFEVDPGSGELRRQGIRVKLQEQPFQVLLALLDRPGQLVTREDLHDRLWPSGSAVDFDRGLNKAINRLRETLGDDAANPRFIETVPQRGYRFLAPVTASAAAEVEAVPRPAAPSRRRWLGAAALAAAATVPAVVIGRRFLATAPPAATAIESLAVLPLENLSGDPAQDYFADGMTEELIGQVALIGSLRVISRTSVMRYKNMAPQKPLPEIARELGVDAIVEGAAMQSGGKVRITAQLIRARDDRHLWAGKYERDVSEVLALQSEVGRAIAGEISAKLNPAPPRRQAANPEAYEAYLHGEYFLHRGIGTIPKSMDWFNRALAIDPQMAAAQVGLAEALCYLGIFGFRPSGETYPEARRAALKALALDDSNAAAHNALADVYKGYDWDFAKAEVEYRRARELNPNHLLTRLWYAEFLTRAGRIDEAMAESASAIALDPVSPLSHNSRAMLLWRARRYEAAVKESARALEVDPNFVNAYWWMGLAQAHLGDHDRAMQTLSKGLALSPSVPLRGALGYVAGVAGRKTEAIATLRQLENIARERYVSPGDFAVVHAGLGDAGGVFRWMEEAVRTKATRVHEITSPYFDRFRSDPRYASLLKRTGLPA